MSEEQPFCSTPDQASDQRSSAVKGLADVVLGNAREAVETIYAARLKPAESSSRVQQVAFGAGLPLAILNAVLRDPAARRLYLRTSLIQSIVTVSVTLFLGMSPKLIAEWVMLDPNHHIQIDFSKSVAFWSSLYVSYCIIEWIVVALSRQYHDEIGRQAALLTGVPPEDEPLIPKIRIQPRWIYKRIKRYWRGLRVIGCGLALLSVLTWIPAVGNALYSVAASLWSGYWIAVFVAAKSAQAWKQEHTSPPPWFLRGWTQLTTHVPGFRWWLPRWIGRLWTYLTRDIFSPAHCVERSPYTFAGLALTRVLGALPISYLFLRPLMPVAVAHIVLGANDTRSLATADRIADPKSPV